jgi:hypothetical protein
MPQCRTLVAVTAVILAAMPLPAQEGVPGGRRDPMTRAAATEVDAAAATTGDDGALFARTETLAPTAEGAAVGVRRTTPTPAPSPLPRRADTKGNRAMMIVGGAALLVGAVIGGNAGTIIMVGGGVVGLYGLYKFLQ